MPTYDKPELAVLIGRFQPFHKGHAALLRQALDTAPRVVLVIGSAFQARTPKNPFTWQERADVIRQTLSSEDQARTTFLPIRDYYDEEKWLQAVRSGVERLAAQRTGICVIGHFKDATSDYLAHFDGWQLISVDRNSPFDATHIRDTYLGSQPEELAANLAALKESVPPATLDFLRAWAKAPVYPALCQEWRMLKKYKEAWSAAPYPPVFVTVDAVVRCADKVLLIKRGQPPGVGLHAVPGGFIEQRETAYQSAIRELREETQLDLPPSTLKAALKGGAVFDHPDRSQRGRTITHAFYFDLGEGPLPKVQADDDAQSAAWVDIDVIPKMEDLFHDDHFHMLDHFLGLTAAPAG
ncbi:MAG: bifunctional nicotinamide-nucleotide adenylyltransferase/Nudix hydroxylase [Aquabacterium sp.]|nr:bifunctional nicotinamide-nucleotide adenylyltransferase/Nudix hydroxylase [Aquabacterium sp.]